MIIRPMQLADLDFAAACTEAEGWASETRAEFEGFFAHDQDGCFVAVADGTRIGICVGTAYDEVGFIGELIVAREMRGRGVGRRLLERAIEHLSRRGVRSVFLDGVLAAVPLYERLGFRKVCRSLRFGGSVGGRRVPHVRAMKVGDLQAISEADREAFGADRRFFLERRLALYPELCLVLDCGGEARGYIMGRRGHGMVAAGPWVVRPGVERPGDLLAGLAAEAGECGLGIGVLETNPAAAALIRSFGLVERSDPPWRMVLGAGAQPGHPEMCYAIGSAAKG